MNLPPRNPYEAKTLDWKPNHDRRILCVECDLMANVLIDYVDPLCWEHAKNGYGLDSDGSIDPYFYRRFRDRDSLGWCGNDY